MTHDNRLGKYRQNVGAILLKDAHVWMGEHINMPGHWQFPQGGQEEGESQEQTLWRELKEELGLKVPERLCRILAVGPPVRYDFHATNPSPVAKIYQGQEQTLFVLAFDGQDSDIDLQAWDEPEFSQFAWVPIEEVAQRIWPIKRHIFEATQAHCNVLQRSK